MVDQPLAFTATTTDGRSFDAEDLSGKDVVLWFWAPWCSQCQREAPHVAAVQAADGDDVDFVGVPGLGPVADMRNFVDQYALGDFPHLVDDDGTLWQRFGVTQQPAYAFIDDSGAVEVVRGELGEAGLADRVAELTAD